MSVRTLHNPKTRETITFLKTSEETGGELLQMSYTMAPRGRIADEHSHPNQEMTITVKSGVLTCTIGGVDRTMRAGDSVVIPPGVPHFQRNDTDEEVHAIEEYRPALRMQGFFEVLAGWANEGKTDEFGLPTPLRLAILLRYFDKTIRSTSVRSNLRARILAPLATLRGYRKELEGYLSSG